MLCYSVVVMLLYSLAMTQALCYVFSNLKLDVEWDLDLEVATNTDVTLHNNSKLPQNDVFGAPSFLHITHNTFLETLLNTSLRFIWKDSQDSAKNRPTGLFYFCLLPLSQSEKCV